MRCLDRVKTSSLAWAVGLLVFSAVAMLSPALGQQSGGGGVPSGGGGGSTDTRPSATATVIGVTLPAGGSYTIFNPGSGAQGTITNIHITLAGTTGTQQTSTLQFQNCGETGTETVDFGTFLLRQDFPVDFSTDWIGGPLSTTGDMTANRRTWINFTNGCTIVLFNGDPSNTATVYADIQYKSGSPANAGPVSRTTWHAYDIGTGTAQPCAALYLLPPFTSTGGGEVESVALWVQDSTNYYFLEGIPVIAADGNTAITANGTEDFFGSGYYFDNGAQLTQTSKWGGFAGTALTSKAQSNDVLAYRLFDTNNSDNVLFNSTLSFLWPAGESSASKPGSPGCPGSTLPYKASVTYWTASTTQPTLPPNVVSISKGDNGATSSTTVVTNTVLHNKGHALVAQVRLQSGTVSGVTNTAGDTWSLISASKLTTGTQDLETWITCSTAGNSADAVTATASVTGTYSAIIVTEVAGTPSTGCVDAAATQTTSCTACTTFSPSLSFTNTGANELVLSYEAANILTPTFTVPSNYFAGVVSGTAAATSQYYVGAPSGAQSVNTSWRTSANASMVTVSLLP